jgi:glycosyltransferase involved in cell wall biosynthesis
MKRHKESCAISRMEKDNLETIGMRTLFVHERFGAFGGAEANILLSAGELRRRSHTTAILHGPGTGRAEAQWSEVFSRCFPLQRGAILDSVQSALWEFEPDVIYLHKMPDLRVLELLLASGIPVVRMVHDHDLYCMRSYKYNFFTRQICRRAASAYCVFGCGAFLARNREGKFPFKWVSYLAKRKEIRLNQKCQRMIVATQYMREELVRNGFDDSRIATLAPVPQPSNTDLQSSFSERNLLLFAGQIIRGKGVDVLLESLSKVKVPFECIILGDGSHRSYCEQLSRELGLDGRVHFKGFVPQAEIKEYYHEASVVLMSSVWPEPFGAIGLEGMRYGLPVVAFDAGGIKEWLIDGQNGRLVPWMDKAAFAQAVEELLLDKQRARALGQNAMKLASAQFDFSNYISGLEGLLEELVQSGKERAVV